MSEGVASTKVVINHQGLSEHIFVWYFSVDESWKLEKPWGIEKYLIYNPESFHAQENIIQIICYGEGIRPYHVITNRYWIVVFRRAALRIYWVS